MKYEIKPSNQFKKDVRLAQKRGYNLSLLTDVIKKSWRTEKNLTKNIKTILYRGI